MWKSSYKEEFYDLSSSPHFIVGDEFKKNGMGGACGMHGREERCIQCFGGTTHGN
jgi:hypothetical protein